MISKSQLQRINAMEKLTDKVKQAIDDKKLSESAATREMATMTAEEQDACLEKILSGEIRGTMQDIQAQKSTEADNIVEEDSDEMSENDFFVDENEEESETKFVTEEKISGAESKLTYPKNLLPDTKSESQEKISVGAIMDVPEEIGDPQKEAEEWYRQENLMAAELLYEKAQRMSEEEPNELKAAQWGIRASVALYHIEELKL